jgi:hypothetical protein
LEATHPSAVDTIATFTARPTQSLQWTKLLLTFPVARILTVVVLREALETERKVDVARETPFILFREMNIK